jgi:hypothetical protein
VASFKQILAQLRNQEQRYLKQLTGIRNAISSLEFGSWAAPDEVGRGRKPKTGARRKRRRFSAATRAKMAAAQRARWARRKGGKTA